MDDAIPHPIDIPAPAATTGPPRSSKPSCSVASSGAARIAAAHVSMSPSAAYQLCRRPEGAAFALGWAAARLIARDRLADELLGRAIYGVEESTERLAEAETQRSFTKRRRQVPSLGLAMLARLDRAIEPCAARQGGGGGEAMLAQIIAGDWAASSRCSTSIGKIQRQRGIMLRLPAGSPAATTAPIRSPRSGAIRRSRVKLPSFPPILNRSPRLSRPRRRKLRR